MPIDLYPNIAKVKRNGVYQNLPGFVQASGDADIKAMIANSESSTTAQYAHPEGSYFILNDVLYKAIIGIAVNDTIAVGTNCEVVILCDEVSEIESDVEDIIENTTELNNLVIKHPSRELTKGDVRVGALQANGGYSASATEGFGIGYKIPLSAGTKIQINFEIPTGLKVKLRTVTFNNEESSGSLTQTGYINSPYVFTQPSGKTKLMYCLFYLNNDDTNHTNILNEFEEDEIITSYTIIDVDMPLAFMDDINNVQAQINSQNNILKPNDAYLNILDGASTFVDNKFINDGGGVVNNPNFCLIDGYYEVKPNTTYKLYRGEPPLYSNSGHNWTFWDENKSFLSYTLSGGAVTSPAKAKYLRFAVYISGTGSVTHETFDASKVIITESANPCFDDIFINSASRPTFRGLKWIGIGDSITEENFRATYHYWDYIKAETGLTFVNMGVSGSGYKAEGSGNKAFYKRAANMATDADVITIFGGVNDIVLSSASIGDETDNTTDTICGCVNETLDVIEGLYPAHMPIGIISPLPCYCTDTVTNIYPDQNPNDDTCRMAEFVEQLALICKHRGIPFLDLFHSSNLRPWHSECNAKYFSCAEAPTGDGLHPNGHGHRVFYRQIMDFVSKIVMQ